MLLPFELFEVGLEISSGEGGKNQKNHFRAIYKGWAMTKLRTTIVGVDLRVNPLAHLDSFFRFSQ
jgi:hypothetical protein